MNIAITVFAKAGGPLTKKVWLDADGKIKSDSSDCRMVHGTARRLALPDIGAFAEAIEQFGPNNAAGLGQLRPGLPERVEITTKSRLNGAIRPDLIARTGENIVFRVAEPALALFDLDAKGMPPDVAERIRGLGGFEPALLSVLSALAGAARLLRASTSAGIYRTDTGERLAGSSGAHGNALVRDGADIERFLKALHERCWLAGLGWYMIGAAGHLLDRSIVDRVVGTPERLVFEGPPVLLPPLAQDAAMRRPEVHEGAPLDTVAGQGNRLKEQRSNLVHRSLSIKAIPTRGRRGLGPLSNHSVLHYVFHVRRAARFCCLIISAPVQAITLGGGVPALDDRREVAAGGGPGARGNADGG